MTDIAPGWYKDPADTTTQRYWDGEGWIGDPIPADAKAPEGPPVLEPSSPPARDVTPGTATPDSVPVAPAIPPVIPGPFTAPPGGPGAGPFPGSAQPPGPGAGLPPGFPNSAAQLNQAMLAGLVPPPRPHGLALAPVTARFVARLIDILVLFGLNVLVNGWFVAQYVQEVRPYLSQLREQLLANESTGDLAASDRAGWLQLTILGIATVLWFAYEVPAIASTGQTLGKRLMQIKVVALETVEPLGIRRAWRRWNPLGLPCLLWTCCGFGFLLQAIDLLAGVFNRPLHLTLHDRTAATVVVQLDRKTPDPSQSQSQSPSQPQPPTNSESSR